MQQALFVFPLTTSMLPSNGKSAHLFLGGYFKNGKSTIYFMGGFNGLFWNC